MLRDFDIFEKFPDGSSIWRVCVSGKYNAQRKVLELAEYSDNEFFAIDITSGELSPFRFSRTQEQFSRAVKRIA